MERRSSGRVKAAAEAAAAPLKQRTPPVPLKVQRASIVHDRETRNIQEKNRIIKEAEEKKSALEKKAAEEMAKEKIPTVVKDQEVPSSSKVWSPIKPDIVIKEEVIMSNAIIEPPEVSGEEVVLNRRGMPQRQRKKNRLYFDDEYMVVGDSSSRKSFSKTKIKDEPIEEMVIEDGPVFQHNEMVVAAPAKKSVAVKKAYSSLPIPVQVAQALTNMVKPRSSSEGKPIKEKFKLTLKGGESRITSMKKSSTAKKLSGRRPSIYKDTQVVKSPRVEGASSRLPARSSVAMVKSGSPTKLKIAQAIPGKSTNLVGKVREIVNIKPDPDDPLSQTNSFNESDFGDNEFSSFRVISPDGFRADRKHKERLLREKDIQKRGQRTRRMSSPSNEVLGSPKGPIQSEICVESERPSLDKKTAQEISLRLRNLLKLPKAHKWVCYEWFYSNIDKVLFEGENDFQICFKESFPQLKTRKLTRVEWTKLRRLMGKPRRCSYAFFDEEREELARRRQKIRMIQQRKVTDFNYKELPDEIPLQLVIGTKVTTRLRRPQDGLFTGTIEGVDTSNNTYRITFDRPGLGTHSIPDYEVLSNDVPETVSTSTFALKIPRRSYFTGNQFKLNPALGDELNKYTKSPFPVDGMLGGFPIRLLDMIVRLSKLLKAKREKILQLKELNVEAEKLRSYNKLYNDDFRTRYARVILDLESMNKEMKVYLEGVQQYCLEIAPDHGSNQMVIPQQVKEQCDQEAGLIVNTYNTRQNREAVHGTTGLTLITRMASLMLQVKALSSGNYNLFELKSIKDTLAEIKASLDGRNLQTFQDRIEIPMNRIQAGLTYSQNGSTN